MTELELKAYFCWRNQRYRCYSKSRRDYRNYGAKGIQVRYGKSEFIAWWMAEYEKKRPKNPSVGRIDHSGHYEFGNVEMIEFSENVKEMHARRGNPGGVKRRLVWAETPTRVVVFSSTRHAARGLGVAQATVVRLCQGKAKRHQKIHRMGYLE